MSEEQQNTLGEKETWNVLQFAQALNGSFGMGVYTPQMLNSNLINLNNNPMVANEKRINQALVNYKSSAKELQAMNEFMEYTDMLFKRTINYYAGLLSFDLSVSCRNAYTVQDYRSEEYKKDRQIVYRFLDKFKYKAELYKITKEVLRHETTYVWKREDTESIMLQIMPQTYCLTTGYFNHGDLLYNFDMSYFLQAGVDIDSYDSIFKTYYNRVFNNPDYEVYKQGKNLNNMDATFAMWTETSPNDGAWAFKMDNTNFNNVPFLSALMKDTVFNDTIRKLQKDKRMLEAQKLILGELPLMSDAKIQKADQFAVDPNTAGQILSLIRSSISDSFKISALPMKEVEEYQFEDKNPNVFGEQISTSAAIGAGASRIIYSSDRMSQEELRLAAMADYQIMRPLYHQFNNFLDFYVNKKTRKYKFRFEFDGSNLSFERKERQDATMKLAENGIVLKPAIQSAFGYTPQSFEAMLMESEAEDFKLESIHTASNKDKGNESGRPVEETVSDSGEKSRNAK